MSNAIVIAMRNEIENKEVPDEEIRKDFAGLSYVEELSNDDLAEIRKSIREHRPELVFMAQADPRLLQTAIDDKM